MSWLESALMIPRLRLRERIVEVRKAAFEYMRGGIPAPALRWPVKPLGADLQRHESYWVVRECEDPNYKGLFDTLVVMTDDGRPDCWTLYDENEVEDIQTDPAMQNTPQRRAFDRYRALGYDWREGLR